MFARRADDQSLTSKGFAWRCANVFVLVLVAILPCSLAAQTASFRAVDTNSDGVLSVDELVAAFGRAGANRLLGSTDRNGDGQITILELRRGPDDDGGEDGQGPGSATGTPNGRDDDQNDDGGVGGGNSGGDGDAGGGGDDDEGDDDGDDGDDGGDDD